MATVKPFRGLRPCNELAAKVASPPYDVIDSDEAREMAKGNPYSFLHVNKPEIDLDASVDIHDERVYEQGAKNLKKLVTDGVFIQDKKPCFYLYRQTMGDHQQTGLVTVTSVDDYDQNKIKKHELTRIDKENDRMKHILSLNAQTGPVFLTYRARASNIRFFEKLSEKDPVYNFVTDDQIRHTFWVLDDETIIRKIEKEFQEIPCLYVADGHHRSAAAARACATKKDNNPHHNGTEEYNFFLTVIFPHSQMKILDYNRVVKDLHGLSDEIFLKRLSEKFLVRQVSASQGYMPSVQHDFGMYLAGTWYRLSAIPGTWEDSLPTKRLDVSILYDNILQPLLGIGDPRTDKRVDFVGGIRGLAGLQKRVDSGEMKVAFSLFATKIEDLLEIADAGEIMPPKSTWFEPKLRSGLVIYLLD
jgi:uncharacterized protein (DUF1015 family)